MSERQLIGALFLSPRDFNDVSGNLEPEHFTDGLCREAFELMARWHKDGRPWSCEDFIDHGFEHETLINWMDSGLSASLIPRYVSDIRSKACFTKMRGIISDPESDIDRVTEVVKEFNEVQIGRHSLSTNDAFEAAIAQAMMPVDTRIEFPMPWIDLNATSGGFRRGTLTFIGARPGHNKSNFLINCLAHLLMRGKKVLMADYELAPEEIIFRFVAIIKGVTLNRMFLGRNHLDLNLDPDERMRLQADMLDVKHRIAQNLTICKHLKMNEIRSEIIRVRPDIVSIDHLQVFAQVCPRRKDESHALHVSDICRQLKHMAQSFNIPFIVPSQVNRVSDGQMPTMADMKESGGIEENADLVVNIYTPFVSTHLESDRGKFHVLVAKNRRGSTGGAELRIDPGTGRIFEREDKTKL